MRDKNLYQYLEVIVNKEGNIRPYCQPANLRLGELQSSVSRRIQDRVKLSA